MLTLKLPDGSARQVAPGSSGLTVAESIGKRLAQAAVAVKVDDAILDLTRELPADKSEVSFQVLTDKDREALDVLRHSCAHVMARAVMRLFPGTQLAFGPTTENGFYYDIDSPTPITEADFPRIEAEMKAIVEAGEPFERFECSIDEGRQLVAELGQALKVEHIDQELAKYGVVSFYRQGEFVDLCRGPHIPHARKIGAFKLLSIAGAYWKGDSSRKQLQRLYGTAFFTQKDLDEYLRLLEEAKKRDHRVLGKQLRLFTISQQAGQGLILWMPKGAMIRNTLEQFIKDELLKRGYSPVYTPHIGKLELYRTSGHFPYYRDAQYPPLYYHPAASALDLCQYRLACGELDESREREMGLYLAESGLPLPGYAEAASQGEKLQAVMRQVQRLVETFNVPLPASDGTPAGLARALLEWLEQQEGYLLKPMNCPHHIQIYKAQPRSYRDLPVRLAEFGTVYRHEQTGELNGLTRVRGFTQDDAHLFVTPEQVEAELEANIDLVLFVFQSLGLSDYRVRVSLRDPASNKYVGPAELWQNAEQTLIRVVSHKGMNYILAEGEAAFYGPKIDFIVRDCIGREWQLGTVQLDYNLPERFQLEYIGADNKPHRPVMIHRAPFGSMERFFGILIEHFAGAFPAWLAPEQVRIIPVRDTFNDYARRVESRLRELGFRATADFRHEDMRNKIREASLEKLPYMLIVGEKEMSSQSVAVRDRHVTEKGGDIGTMPLDQFIARLTDEVKNRTIREQAGKGSSFSAGIEGGPAKFAG